jgi:cytochrome c
MKYVPQSGRGLARLSNTMNALKARTGLIGWLALLLSTSIPAPAMSQQIGDAKKGMQYALKSCSECQAVRHSQLLSPLPKAPRFDDVANIPGMTAITLTAWFQTSHPNIVMTDAEMRMLFNTSSALRRTTDPEFPHLADRRKIEYHAYPSPKIN